MNLLRGLATIPLVAVLLADGVLPNAHAVTIDWVTVGDPDKAPDPATGNQYGAVAKPYRIMKFEFTNSQYAAFLNAIDPDGTNLNPVYNGSMGSDARGGITNTGTTNGSRYAAGPNMGDKPVNFVSWWDAARVCNWLHNGAKTFGSTDSAGGVGKFANLHSGADWNEQNGNVKTVGTNGGASYYGAFDMSGNVYEWTDSTGAAGSTRELGGGGWVNSAPNVTSRVRGPFDPSREGNSGGFRLASPVP